MKQKPKTQWGSEPHTIRHPNGNQGFNSRVNTLGGDTQPGPGPGAPLSSKKEQLVTKKYISPSGLNSFNTYEANAPGVLGPEVVRQNAPAKDSPVPLGTQHPDLAVRSKAAEVAKEDPNMGLGERPRGVLGQG